jgi:hypothetical protein
MHEVVWVLTNPKTNDNAITWTHENKVRRHSILSTLSNELFNVYCCYKKVNEIWSNMVTKYTIEDVGKQKFVTGKFIPMGNSG